MSDKWKPTESVDFYRGQIAVYEKFIKQTNNALSVLPERISEKTKDSKHQTTLIVAARKHVYDSTLNICKTGISEARRMIKWIETGKHP